MEVIKFDNLVIFKIKPGKLLMLDHHGKLILNHQGDKKSGSFLAVMKLQILEQDSLVLMLDLQR